MFGAEATEAAVVPKASVVDKGKGENKDVSNPGAAEPVGGFQRTTGNLI